MALIIKTMGLVVTVFIILNLVQVVLKMMVQEDYVLIYKNHVQVDFMTMVAQLNVLDLMENVPKDLKMMEVVQNVSHLVHLVLLISMTMVQGEFAFQKVVNVHLISMMTEVEKNASLLEDFAQLVLKMMAVEQSV